MIILKFLHMTPLKYIKDRPILIAFIFLGKSIRLQKVNNVCVCSIKNFSETTSARILEFGTNVVHDELHCIREHQPPPTYCSLYYTPRKLCL